MMKITKILLLVAVAISLMACSLTVNVPTVQTTVTDTLEISEPALTDSGVNKIYLEMGAGRLTLSGGATNLVEGSIRYNVANWKANIHRGTDELSISQNSSGNMGIPDNTIINEWQLQLGDYPIDLSLSTGAYEGDLDLSGLSITSLDISDGASKSRVHFDSPNPVEMEQLSYKTGASDVELEGLGYANVSEISFDSGVGSYTLDFTGDLQRDVNVRIQSGMSDIEIVIPESTHTIVTLNGGLSNIDANGTWSISGTTYECGSGSPTINIVVDMAVGNLQLIQQ